MVYVGHVLRGSSGTNAALILDGMTRNEFSQAGFGLMTLENVKEYSELKRSA